MRTAPTPMELTLLVGASCHDVAQHLPFFDHILPIDDHQLMGAGHLSRLAGAARLTRLLRQKNFTQTIIFHRDWRYGLLTRLAGIPIRRGLTHLGNVNFLTHPHCPAPGEHHVLQYLSLAARLSTGTDTPPALPDAPLSGIWKFFDGEKDRALAKARSLGFDPARKTVALGFGGGRNVKTQTHLKWWPIESYKELARKITGAGFQVVWLGDQADAGMLGGGFEGISLAGHLLVEETAVILSLCHKTVSNDTLILHLCEAVGVPVVGIFGPTDPAHYRPLSPRSSFFWIGKKADCCPCHVDGWFPDCPNQHQCMKSIGVEPVFAKLMEPL
ncbi:MAG: glycosyltransferase family 9 protein [Verrucomicrobiae bacterium]|nr:glycosyltransferase family 9 protein [Verrucomicrobiae bacterium]